jgi:predicted MFS family arabinose efflux permease
MPGSVTRLAVAWCTLFVIGTDLFVVSPLLPSIANQFGVPSAEAGLSVTAFAIAYMVSAPFFGQVADRVGRLPMLSWCLVGFAAANLLTAAASSLGWLLAARALAGAATAGVSPSIYALVGEAAPPARRASWMAIAVSGLLCSLSFGAPLGALIGEAFGWVKVFDLLAGLSLFLVLCNRRVWSAAAGAVAVTTAAGAPIGALLLRMLPIIVWSTALYGVYTYLGAWLSRRGFSTEDIAQVILCYGIGAIVGALGGGRVADRIGVKAAMAWSLFGLFLAFALLPFLMRSGIPIGVGFGVASVLAQVFFPAQQAGLVADFPTQRATALAWNSSSLFLGIALGSLLGSQIAAHGSFETSLMVGAGIALIGVVVNWLVVPPRQPVRSAPPAPHRIG